MEYFQESTCKKASVIHLALLQALHRGGEKIKKEKTTRPQAQTHSTVMPINSWREYRHAT